MVLLLVAVPSLYVVVARVWGVWILLLLLMLLWYLFCCGFEELFPVGNELIVLDAVIYVEFAVARAVRLPLLAHWRTLFVAPPIGLHNMAFFVWLPSNRQVELIVLCFFLPRACVRGYSVFCYFLYTGRSVVLLL